MAKFLILYRSPHSAAEQMASADPAAGMAEMAAGNAWGQAAGSALVDFGAPTMATDDADPGPAGHIGGYSIMQADDAAALQQSLVGHPHLKNGSIEVHQLLDMPSA